MEGPVSIADFPDARHAFLIRDPRRVAASYAAKRSAIRAEHLGTARQLAYFRAVADRTGVVPPVIDSDDVLRDPGLVLARLCKVLDLTWDPAMLGWSVGPHPSDGVWGAHWYDKVNSSTGFDAPPDELPSLAPDYAEVAAQCMNDYSELLTYAIAQGSAPGAGIKPTDLERPRLQMFRGRVSRWGRKTISGFVRRQKWGCRSE